MRLISAISLTMMVAAVGAFVTGPRSLQLTPARPVLTPSTAASTMTRGRDLSCSLVTGFGQRLPAIKSFIKKRQESRLKAASLGLDGGKKRDWFEVYKKTSEFIVNLFPVWTVICSVLALWRPSLFNWLTTNYFTAGLGLLMLSMGITLSPQDFANVLKRPAAVIVGFLGCYAFMPALAMGVSQAFQLSPELAAGLVLVGSINGGQASNLCTYIAKGDVALSVLMTTATTLGAIIMTPLLCKTLLGTVVPLDAVGISYSTVQVVLAPIALGMLANKYLHKQVEAVLPFAPIVGMVSTCLLVASAVGQCSQAILNAGWALQLAALSYHLIGGVVGYAAPKLLGFSETDSRTMAIETAMKSSAFGFLLAKLHFGSYLARVPPAVSVVWMAVTGSTLAVIWRYIPVKDGPTRK